MATWFACTTPDRAVEVRVLVGYWSGPGRVLVGSWSDPGRVLVGSWSGSGRVLVRLLCSWARHLTLTAPLFTQFYKWVPANLMLRGNPAID